MVTSSFNNLGDNFYKKLLEVSNSVGMKPEDILNVMSLESGMNASAYNEKGHASGIVQIIPSTLRQLGYTGNIDDFRKTTGVAQLEYVQKLIENGMKANGGPFKSVTQYYVSHFLPVASSLAGVRREDPNTIIISKNPDKPHLPGVNINTEAKYYNANSGLDVDHDGNITYGDLQASLSHVASSKVYKQALQQLEAETGYKSNEPLDKYVKKYDKAISNTPITSNTPATSNTSTHSFIKDIIEKYLGVVISSEKQNKKLYKNFLPINSILINVNSSDFTDSVEFSRILCSVLDEELFCKAFTYTDGNNIEVQCNIVGPKEDCLNLINKLTSATVDMFKIATEKVGGIDINTSINVDKKSSYKEITLTSAESNYRKFLLKFI